MSVTDKKPWEKYSPEIAESDDLKPWEKYVPSEEKKKPVQNDLTSGTQTSKRGFEPFQTPVDTKTPSVLTPKGKTEYQEQVKAFKPLPIPKEGEPKPKKADGGGATSFMKGLNDFNSNVFKTPRLLYDAASSITDTALQALNLQQDETNYDDIVAASGYTSPLSVLDRLGDYYAGKSNQYAKRQEKFDKGIIDSFTSGDIKGGGKQLWNNIAESIPSMVGMALTGGAGNVAKLGYAKKTLASALPFISGKNAELSEDESIPKPVRVANSVLSGLSEVVFDQSFGTTAMVNKVVGEVFKNEGRDAAIKVGKDFIVGYANNAIKKIQPLTGLAKGVVEEMATTMSTNIVDKYTIDPERDLMEGVLDAGLVGGVMTGGVGVIGTVAYSSSQKKKVADLMKQREELVNDLDNDNLPDEVKSDLSDNLSKIDNQISKIDDDNEAVVSRLSDEDKAIIQEKEVTINAIEKALQDETISETTKNTLADKLLKEQDAVDEILTKPLPPLEKPTIDTEEQIDEKGDLQSIEKKKLQRVLNEGGSKRQLLQSYGINTNYGEWSQEDIDYNYQQILDEYGLIPIEQGGQDAVKTRNIEQGNITEREGVTEQQQRQQEDRKDQEEPVTESQAETGGGNIVSESREVKKDVGSGVKITKYPKTKSDSKKEGFKPIFNKLENSVNNEGDYNHFTKKDQFAIQIEESDNPKPSDIKILRKGEDGSVRVLNAVEVLNAEGAEKLRGQEQVLSGKSSEEILKKDFDEALKSVKELFGIKSTEQLTKETPKESREVKKDVGSGVGGDVEATAKKIVGESAFDKLKKEGYTIEKGKFDSDAYASFFGLHTGVQADEFANAGLRLVKPSEKIKVYRGKGKNVSEGENEGVTWVAEDKKVAENYSNDGNVEEIEVTKPKNPFPNPTDTIHVKGSDVGNKLKGILNRLFREGKVTKEQAIEASKAIDEFVLAAGEESELYSTKTNKKGVSSKYVKALQALGFDGIVQKESYNSGSPFTATKTGNETNTYGIFKAVEQSLKESQSQQVSTMDTKVDTKVEKVEPTETTTPKVKLNPTESGQNTATTTSAENAGTEQGGGGLEQSKEQTQPTLIGKDRIAQGLDELAQILGAKQNITGDNPKLIDALTKIGLGLIEMGVATIDNVIEKIKEKINNSNINVDDYKDAILSNMPTSKENSIKKLVEQWKADGLSDTEIKNILSESETGKTFIDKLFPKEPKERSFSRTLEDMPTQVQNLVENKDYIPTTNPEQEAVADNFIKENGIEEATKILIDNKTSELSDAETNIVAMKLIKINNKNGNYKESARIFDEVAEKLTEAGRLIQTAALWNMMTEQGAVEYAMRLKSKGRNAQKEVVEQEVKTTQDKISEIAKQINGSKEIKDAIAKIYSKRERISKTKSQKAIDWLESIKIKGVAFSTLPGVNLLPATYNTAINIIQTGIKANIMLNTAIAQAVKYVRENITADESFDENKFKKFILDNLPKIQEDAIKVAEEELGKKISDVVNAHYDIQNEYKKSLLENILSKTDLTEDEAKIISNIVETKFAQEADKKLDYIEKKQKAQAKKIDEKIAKVESEIKAIENGTYKQDKKFPTTKSEKQKELDALRKQKRELLGTEQPYVKIVDRINKGTISKSDMKELLYADIGLSNLDAVTIAKIEELHKKVQDAPAGSSEQRDRLADLLDFIDKEINGTDNWAIAKSLMYASLLSATSTQVKNFVSNTMQMTAEAYVNSMLMLAKGDAKGISGLVKGLIVGLKRGGLEAMKVLKTGYDPNKKALLLDSNPKISRKDVLESYTGKIKPISWAKYVRRLMVAADTLFYYGVKEMESYVLARQIALKSGLKGKALADKIDEILLKGESYYNDFKKQAIQEGYLDEKSQKRRIFELIELNRDRNITDKADVSALKATYNNDPIGTLGALSRGLQSLTNTISKINKPLGLAITSIIPFTRVISNVVNEQLNWTPLGYARALTEKGSVFASPEQMKLTDEERSKLVIKATTGMLLAIGFLSYALMGDDDEDKIFDVTANGYGNSYKNSSLYPLGWKPYTIGVKMPNGEWVRYNYQNTPFGQLFGMIGTIADNKKYNKDSDMTDRVGLFTSTTLNQIFNASALQGASTLFDALASKDSDNMNKILELAISKAKMPIPNITKEAYNLFDNQLYDKSDIKGMVINNVPVFQLLGKPKLNVFGEPIKKSRYGALLLMPETDKTLKSLYEVGVVPSMPLKNKKIYGKEMNNEQFYDYVETRGKYLREITENNLDYITSITDEKQAKKAYNEIENQASNYAEDVIYNMYFK